MTGEEVQEEHCGTLYGLTPRGCISIQDLHHSGAVSLVFEGYLDRGCLNGRQPHLVKPLLYFTDALNVNAIKKKEGTGLLVVGFTLFRRKWEGPLIDIKVAFE